MEKNNADKNTSNKNNVQDGTFKITGDWKSQSELLQDKFPQLTAADLKFEQGQEDSLLTRVESRIKKSRTEVINIIRKGVKDKV